MQIQSPFQVTFNGQNYNSFADYFFASTAEYGTRLALVDSEGGGAKQQQWRFAEISQWTGKATQRMREIGVNAGLCQHKKEVSDLDTPASEMASPMSTSTTVLRDKHFGNQNTTNEESFSNDTEQPSKSNAYLILFTSGTTRQPKPVQITHQTLIANLQCLRLPIYGPPLTTDRFLLTLCLSTLYGFYSAYHALINGSELYMIRKHSNKVFLKSLVDYRITYVHVVPSIIQYLSNDLSLENVNLKPHLRTIICGGAPIDARLARQCKERLGIRDIRQVYGMTELGGPSLVACVGCDNIEAVRPLPGVVAKIIQWDSTNIFANIYRNTKATSDLLTSDGYVKTGDAALYDEQGLIYVLDRVKDIIKYRGSLICPSDVESTLRSHPGIEDCAVVGRQDHVSGEVPAAFVVKRNTHLMLSTSEIRQHVSGKIPQFKGKLRGGVFFISEIPRSICGKIMRQNLRQHWDRERMGSRSEINGISALARGETPPPIAKNSRKASKTIEELAKK
ncbi:hypothetical protein M3Y97_00896500 [Aphelenchoides bicaudatus]|nr:hypothetical protein M3Y97_00896500 [Aphelenchoides bicaudatus]